MANAWWEAMTTSASRRSARAMANGHRGCHDPCRTRAALTAVARNTARLPSDRTMGVLRALAWSLVATVDNHHSRSGEALPIRDGQLESFSQRAVCPSYAPEVVRVALDVVLAEVVASLHLDDHNVDIAIVSQSVTCAAGNVDCPAGG